MRNKLQKKEIERLDQETIFFQELETILTYAHEGVQLVDQEGIIRYINPGFTRITGILPEERIGKHIADVSPDGALLKALETQKPILDWRNKVLGSGVEVISNAAPIFIEGKMMGAVVTFQDVSQIIALSKQLQVQEKKISQLHEQLRNINQAKFSFADIIGESKAIQEAVLIAKKSASTNSTVLITGESGTGKELFAHAIHGQSSRRNQPFIIVNCAAIPETLLESELFGYERGAFTNADRSKPGKIEIANGGTLFLDEIGDMSTQLQAKLLRVLQSKQIERLGGLRSQDIDVRIIAATNRELTKLIRQDRFREDLYYRLNVVRIEVPPLRRRLADLPLIVAHLLIRIGRRTGIKATLSNKATSLLVDYHWPGNVRELESFLERVINENGSGVIPDVLISKYMVQLSIAAEKGNTFQLDCNDEGDILPLKLVERRAIQQALHRFGNTVEGKKKAASLLGISLATLYNKLKDSSF